jgi:hypothetical protein
MKLQLHLDINRKICVLAFVVGVAALMFGCTELNTAVDNILGAHSPAIASASKAPVSQPPSATKEAPVKTAQPPVVIAQAAPEPPKPPQEPAKGDIKPDSAPEGKKRPPGQVSPVAAAPQAAPRKQALFAVERDPFKQPTEILPSECPPSMPLCRFDRSQLKLVGVLQISDGQFKAMVEDPDGRGYFIIPGMRIGGDTVTQVTNKGLTIHLHRTNQDVLIPLYREPKEGEEF